MKSTQYLYLVFLFPINIFAQVMFEDHVIFDNLNLTGGINSVSAADIDGDGDMDVLSVSSNEKQIVWYENTDGLGNFELAQIITQDGDGANFVYAADMDGDGDIDVLSACGDEDKVAWYENTDGTGSFSAQKIITTQVNYARSVHATDIDGDGDMDVLSASSTSSGIAWYENIDGTGNFGDKQSLTSDLNKPISLDVADINGDGAMDILAAFSVDDGVAWFRNLNGMGDFGLQNVITYSVMGIRFVIAEDIDGDGDMDVISASSTDDKVAWYENVNGTGNFGNQKIITTNADLVRSVHAADIDGDGDIDILSASEFDDKIAWYENLNGMGEFSAQQIITTNSERAWSVFSTDIDGDGDMDVLSGSISGDKLAWAENIGIVGLNNIESQDENIDIFPTPTLGLINIKSNIEIERIEIYNHLGQLVLINSNKTSINISHLAKGLYFCRIKDIYENSTTQKVVKK